MATGKLSGQAGNAVPLNGESEIRQASSGTDVLTITMASGVSDSAAGKPLVIRTWQPDGMGSSGSEIFSVDALGNVNLKAGAGISVGASGALAIPVTPVVAIGAGDSYTVLAANAGKLHYYTGPSTAGGMITLPAASGLTVGTNFSFLFGAAAIASGTRVSSSLSSSDDILFQSSGIAGSTGKVMQVTATGLQLGSALKLTLITAKRWWAESLSVTSTIGGWAVVAA